MMKKINNNKKVERTMWKSGTFIYPIPAVMVSCGNMEKANIITVAWTGILNTNPATCYISVRPERYSHGIIKSIGSREQEETIAHHLYEVLREFDSCNVSAIYSEAFFTPRMGQAIMNRLLKAAGHKIINVEEEKENDSTGM